MYTPYSSSIEAGEIISNLNQETAEAVRKVEAGTLALPLIIDALNQIDTEQAHKLRRRVIQAAELLTQTVSDLIPPPVQPWEGKRWIEGKLVSYPQVYPGVIMAQEPDNPLLYPTGLPVD